MFSPWICCQEPLHLGFPGDTSGREPACQYRRHKRHRFDSWVGKIPWRRNPPPVFLPGWQLSSLFLGLKAELSGQMSMASQSQTWLRYWLIGKDPDAWIDWRQEEKGITEDEMVGWHHRLYGHEFEQAPGVSVVQGSLACCSPWGHKDSDTTERMNWTELIFCISDKSL